MAGLRGGLGPEPYISPKVKSSTNILQDHSNAVDLWDSIPRYSIFRVRMNAMRTTEGFLAVAELGFNYRGKPLTARIYPAQVKGRDGKWISFYPSAREELVEHALRKISAEQHAGFFDQPNYRSGARFSLHQLRSELEQQGHSLRYDELVEALDILSLSSIELEGATDEGDEAFARSTYLAALSGVKRKDYQADRDAKWAAQFQHHNSTAVYRIIRETSE